MGRLVFFLVGVADEHAAQADKGQLAVRFRVLDLLAFGPELGTPKTHAPLQGAQHAGIPLVRIAVLKFFEKGDGVEVNVGLKQRHDLAVPDCAQWVLPGAPVSFGDAAKVIVLKQHGLIANSEPAPLLAQRIGHARGGIKPKGRAAREDKRISLLYQFVRG